MTALETFNAMEITQYIDEDEDTWREEKEVNSRIHVGDILLGALLGKAFTAAGHVSTDKAVLVRAESHMWLILSLLTQIVLDGCSRTLSVRRKLASGSAWGRGFVFPAFF